MQDWRAAVAYARTLEGVDERRIVLWGFSLGGGHAVETAAADPRIAATLALCPMLDGLARVIATPARLQRLADPPRARRLSSAGTTSFRLTAQPGGRAAMTLPGEADGFAAVVRAGLAVAQRDLARRSSSASACTARCGGRGRSHRRSGWASASTT